MHNCIHSEELQNFIFQRLHLTLVKWEKLKSRNWSNSGAKKFKKLLPWVTTHKYLYQHVYFTDPSEICSVDSLQDSSEGLQAG